MSKEKQRTEENKDDVFTCGDCHEKTTRDEILKNWDNIPFCNEEDKSYYCGCYEHRVC